jgi:hypothetical protein
VPHRGLIDFHGQSFAGVKASLLAAANAFAAFQDKE